MARIRRIYYFLLRQGFFQRSMFCFYAVRRTDLVSPINFFYFYRHITPRYATINRPCCSQAVHKRGHHCEAGYFSPASRLLSIFIIQQ